MKKLLFFTAGILMFLLLISQLLFILWINSFIGLYYENSKQKVGFIKDNLFFFYTNSSPIAIILLNRNKLYSHKLIKNIPIPQKQLCIQVPPKYRPYLKLLLACKPIVDQPGILDKIFCKYPILTLNMIQSCNQNDFTSIKFINDLKPVYITKQGFKISHEN